MTDSWKKERKINNNEKNGSKRARRTHKQFPINNINFNVHGLRDQIVYANLPLSNSTGAALYCKKFATIIYRFYIFLTGMAAAPRNLVNAELAMGQMVARYLRCKIGMYVNFIIRSRNDLKNWINLLLRGDFYLIQIRKTMFNDQLSMNCAECDRHASSCSYVLCVSSFSYAHATIEENRGRTRQLWVVFYERVASWRVYENRVSTKLTCSRKWQHKNGLTKSWLMFFICFRHRRLQADEGMRNGTEHIEKPTKAFCKREILNNGKIARKRKRSAPAFANNIKNNIEMNIYRESMRLSRHYLNCALSR